MMGLSKMIMALANLKMYKSIDSIDFRSISKDHIGELRVNFQDEIIQVSVFTFDDEFAVSERIIEKSLLK
jgi:hypothetical protein